MAGHERPLAAHQEHGYVFGGRLCSKGPQKAEGCRTHEPEVRKGSPTSWQNSAFLQELGFGRPREPEPAGATRGTCSRPSPSSAKPDPVTCLGGPSFGLRPHASDARLTDFLLRPRGARTVHLRVPNMCATPPRRLTGLPTAAFSRCTCYHALAGPDRGPQPCKPVAAIANLPTCRV